MDKTRPTDRPTLTSIGLFAAALALGAAGAAAALSLAQREGSADRAVKECSEAVQRLEARLDERQTV